jgi:hypothetical protein
LLQNLPEKRWVFEGFEYPSELWFYHLAWLFLNWFIIPEQNWFRFDSGSEFGPIVL